MDRYSEGKQQKMDGYGNVVAAHNEGPGAGYVITHNSILEYRFSMRQHLLYGRFSKTYAG
eukprot:11423328-Ditylum_brightwellii.AAC.2